MTQFQCQQEVVQTLPSGDQLTIPVYRLTPTHKQDDQEIPHVYLQANMHGAEIQGNQVLFELIKMLSKQNLRARITLVPLCNPMAINQKIGQHTYGRFTIINGTNWNRAYHDLLNQEEVETFLSEKHRAPWREIKKQFKCFLQEKIKHKRAQQKNPMGVYKEEFYHTLILQQLSYDADYVFDLHTGPCSTEYLYFPKYALEGAKQLGWPNMVMIPEIFYGAMDEAAFIPWVKLKNTLEKSHGRKVSMEFESYTLELGSEERLDKHLAIKQAQRLFNFFCKRGLIDGTVQEGHSKNSFLSPLDNLKTLHSPFAGMVEYCKSPGEWINKGDPLLRILQLNHHQNLEHFCQNGEKFLYAEHSGVLINNSCSSILAQGMSFMQMLVDPQKIPLNTAISIP